MLSDEMRDELVQGLTDIFRNNISMIILYGSAARGDATQESDIDIAIVVKNQMDDATKRRFLSWAADMDIRYEDVINLKKNIKQFKNDKGESIRKDSKFDKQYLEGKHSADPYFRKIVAW